LESHEGFLFLLDDGNCGRKIEQLTIFSDSQTAIGILTLHWKIENHKRITLEILDKHESSVNAIAVLSVVSVIF
jgi:hypothetical protein